MEKIFSYRIVKIGGKAVSVALTAFGLMSVGVQAADVNLGTSFFSPNTSTPIPSLTDGATAAAASYSNGTDRWNLSTADYSFSNDRWRNYNIINPGYATSVSRAGDLFYGNTVTYWRNDVASQNGSNWVVESWTDAGFSADAVRDSQYRSNVFGAIVDGASNNYNFGLGTVVSSVLRGSKAYAFVGDFTPDRDVNALGVALFAFNTGSLSQNNPDGWAIDVAGSVSFAGGNTVDGNSRAQNFTITGNGSLFNGSVTATSNGAVAVNGNDNAFNGTVSAGQVNLTGDNTSFAGNVTVSSGLNFFSGVTASLTNGADLTGNVNFAGYNGNLRLNNGSNVTGNITTDSGNSNSGIVTFGGDSTVVGHIGAADARIRQIDVNGNLTRTVSLVGMNYVNLVNINTAGKLIIGDGHNTDGLDTTGTVGGRVDFNNTAGSVTLANLGTITGQIVSTGGSNAAGTASAANVVNFSQNGRMIGNIGTSATNRIGSVNVGSVAAGVVDMTGDLFATQLNISSSSTLNILGDVVAATTLGSTGVNGSATLAVNQGDVTGAVITANNGQGNFTLVGGTQTVTGNMGASAALLAAVNAGANSADATLNGNVFATQLNVTGTGTVNLNGNFTGDKIHYQANGQVNVGTGQNINGAVTTLATNSGTLTMLGGAQTVSGPVGETGKLLQSVNAGQADAASTFGGNVFATHLNVTGTGTVNLNGNFTGNAIHYNNGGDGIVKLAADKSITGAVTTHTDTTGTLTVLGGVQAVSGNVGAADGKSLKRVNVGEAAGSIAGTLTTNSIWATTIATNNDSTLIVRSGQNITGAVTTETNNTGTLTMGGATQSITGTVGMNGGSLKLVNVGEVTGTVAGTLTADSIWATETAINNRSTLDIRDGHNIQGLVKTEESGTGTLSMKGGDQQVTGTVGANAMRLAVVNAGATQDNTTTFRTDVFANDLNVTGAGTVLFEGHFSGNAVNLQADGVVSLAADKNMVGTIDQSFITTASNNTGKLNLLGGTQTITGVVGADGNRLEEVNAGSAGASSNFTSHVYAQQLNVTGTGEVNLNGHFTGDKIHYQANGQVNVSSGKDITEAVTTATTDTGTLTMLGGAQTVSGNVGAANASLATVNAGELGGVTTMNGMVYATNLNYIDNGTVILNGINGNTGGLVGTVNFGPAGSGELQIGNDVNLTTGDSGIRFANANTATLRFNGSSEVTGVLGAPVTNNALDNSTLGSIFAGIAGEMVTFKDNVHVSGSTFHVSGTGVVNLEGDLFGPLVFNADGTVNVSNGKSIRNDGTAVLGTVTTTMGNGITGTLNYLGSTTLSNDLGTVNAALKSVNFHSDGTVDTVAQTLNKNIYATTTTIGNATKGTTANITENVYLGNSLTLAASNVTLNTAQQDVARVGNTLTFAHSALDDGRLSTTATMTNATTGTGAITTNGATLNFSVATQPWAGNAGGVKAAGSSIGGGNGTLVMDGSEKVNIALLGSLKNGQTQTLVNVGTSTDAQTGAATDNSYVIDSVLSRAIDGDLVVAFNRDAQSYVTKSATEGHFSQAAATRLGTLAADGEAYSADMQRVINTLDLDQWGYGNNEGNLATQVKRLAPISNGSITLSAIDAGVLALNTMGNRMASMRADNSLVGIDDAAAEGRDGQWIKLVGNNTKQSAKGVFDGYSARTNGLVWGADTRVNKDTLLGLGLSVTNTSVDQKDFRAGQGSTIRSHELAGYGAYQFNQNIYGEASLSYAHHSITGNRMTAIDRMAKADYDANQLTARLGLGYRYVLAEKQTLTPMLNLESSRLRSDAYAETGADALGLKFNEHTMTRNRSSLGLRYMSESKSATDTVFRPELTAEVYRDNKAMSQNVTAAFAGDLTGATFTTTGVESARSGYKLSAGVSILNSKTSLVQLHYGFDHRTGFTNHSARIKARWDF